MKSRASLLLKNSLKPFFSLFLFSFLISYQLQAQKPITENTTVETPTNEWAIKVQPGQSIEAIAAAVNAEVVGPIGTLKDYYLLRANESESNLLIIDEQLTENENVAWSERQVRSQKSKKNWNDPRLGDQWHLNNTGQRGGTAGVDANVFPAWNLGVTGAGVQICIIDDGVERTHEDLSTNFMLADSRDLNGNNGNDPSPTSNGDDHGTACAGVAAAIGNNNTGVSGAASNANLSAVRLIAGPNTPADETTALTLNYNNNDIFSNSWGPFDNGAYHQIDALPKAALLDGATNGRNGLGSIYTWAAGNGRANNDNTNYDGYVNDIHTIGVGAHADNGIFSEYSEPGASMLISAPSDGNDEVNAGITTTDLNDGYTDNFGGTSSATPLVSGIIALMLEANPNLTWRDVQHILVENATIIDAGNADWTQNGAGKDINHAYGFGGVDAAALVMAAQNWVSVADAVSDTATIITVNKAIPDGIDNGVYGEAVEASTNIASDIIMEHVELKVNITHTYRGDLRVRLISPAGTVSVLSTQSNDSADNLSDWYFMTVRNWGENAMGEWTVLIDDGFDADTGTFIDFQLIIHGTAAGCVASMELNDQTIPADIYEASDHINSNGTVATSTTVEFHAGLAVRLNPGFHAESGSNFVALINDCSPGALRSNDDRTQKIQLETPTATVEQAVPTLVVYPNPVAHEGTMRLSLLQQQAVRVFLMDALGKQVAELQPQTLLSKGQHDLPLGINRLELNNGIYFVVASIDNEILAKKISLLR
ncbi:MAG: S8 family serine peptidase [Bacteroidota bacterium]